jgi:phage shock protein A
MRDDLSNLRSSIIEVITEQQYNQAQAEVLKWEERVKLALDKGDESLAQEANIKKKHPPSFAGKVAINVIDRP